MAGRPEGGTGEADLESFDFAEPALAFSFANASDEVIANFDQSIALCWVWPHQCPQLFASDGRF